MYSVTFHLLISLMYITERLQTFTSTQHSLCRCYAALIRWLMQKHIPGGFNPATKCFCFWLKHGASTNSEEAQEVWHSQLRPQLVEEKKKKRNIWLLIVSSSVHHASQMSRLESRERHQEQRLLTLCDCGVTFEKWNTQMPQFHCYQLRRCQKEMIKISQGFCHAGGAFYFPHALIIPQCNNITLININRRLIPHARNVVSVTVWPSAKATDKMEWV